MGTLENENLKISWLIRETSKVKNDRKIYCKTKEKTTQIIYKYVSILVTILYINILIMCMLIFNEERLSYLTSRQKRKIRFVRYLMKKHSLKLLWYKREKLSLYVWK